MKKLRYSSAPYQLAAALAEGNHYKTRMDFSEPTRKTWEDYEHRIDLTSYDDEDLGENAISLTHSKHDGRGVAWSIRFDSTGRSSIDIDGRPTKSDLRAAIVGALYLSREVERLTQDLNDSQARFDEQTRKASQLQAQVDTLRLERISRDEQIQALQGDLADCTSSLAVAQTDVAVLQDLYGDDGRETKDPN